MPSLLTKETWCICVPRPLAPNPFNSKCWGFSIRTMRLPTHCHSLTPSASWPSSSTCFPWSTMLILPFVLDKSLSSLTPWPHWPASTPPLTYLPVTHPPPTLTLTLLPAQVFPLSWPRSKQTSLLTPTLLFSLLWSMDPHLNTFGGCPTLHFSTDSAIHAQRQP